MLKNKRRSLRDYLFIGLKGMAMGAADVVPGVSGGTVAFITGIYDELLHSLKSITPGVLTTLVRKGFVAAWQEVNASFLLALFAGVLISFKLFASAIAFGLEEYPVVVWAFFMGLIIASVLLFAKEQKGWHLKHWGACIFGCLVVVLISEAAPSQLPGSWWTMFLGGFVAICAMILPGISGSFILMLAGLYTVMISAINELNWLLMGSFGLGCVCGLLVFSRFLSWLLERYHKETFALLIGFLIGSLKVVWPWKYTLEYFHKPGGKSIPIKQENVMPLEYEALTGEPSMLLLAISAAFIGLVLVLSAEFMCKGNKNKGIKS